MDKKQKTIIIILASILIFTILYIIYKHYYNNSYTSHLCYGGNLDKPPSGICFTGGGMSAFATHVSIL